ncbi:MAG: hypothetical protein ACYTG1_13295 [Planctomycetota bacterium]|jgi:hypothetical protein
MRRTRVIILGAVGLVVLSVTGVLGWAHRTPSSAAVTPTPEPSPTPPIDFSRPTLHGRDGGDVHVAVTPEILAALTAHLETGEDAAVERLRADGRVITVPAGTPCVVVVSVPGSPATKIRVDRRLHAGEVGWVHVDRIVR